MSERRVRTVLGDVAGSELGKVLPHEHLLIYNTSWWMEPEDVSLRALANAKVTLENLGLIKRDPIRVRDNLILDDIELAIREVELFRRAGGQTIVDLTNQGLGRDAKALVAIARAAGVHIVMGSGHYVHKTHPPEMDDWSVEEIAEGIVRDVVEGVGPSKIRSGIIGEVGTSAAIHPNEAKCLRAAARAQNETGAAINVHAAQWSETTTEILDVLESAGADLTRVVVSHRDQKHPLREQVMHHLEIARRGAYVEYDVWGCEWDFEGLGEGIPSDHDRVEGFVRLAEAGYLDRLLASHDICTKTQLRAFGGYGYAHVITNGATLLSRAGFSHDELNVIFVENPRRILELQAS